MSNPKSPSYDPSLLDPRSPTRRKSRLFASQCLAVASEHVRNTTPLLGRFSSFPAVPRPPSCPPQRAVPPPPLPQSVPKVPPPPPIFSGVSGSFSNSLLTAHGSKSQPEIRSSVPTNPSSTCSVAPPAKSISQPALIVRPTGLSTISSIGSRPSERESEHVNVAISVIKNDVLPSAKRLCVGKTTAAHEEPLEIPVIRDAKESPSRKMNSDRDSKMSSSSRRRESRFEDSSRTANNSVRISQQRSLLVRPTKEDSLLSKKLVGPNSSISARKPVSVADNSSDTSTRNSSLNFIPYRFLEAEEFYQCLQGSSVTATDKLKQMHELFRCRIMKEFDRANKKREAEEDTESSSEESDRGLPEKHKQKKVASDTNTEPKKDRFQLHEDLPFNMPNRLNDGKACCCSKVLRGYGTKHGHLVGEENQKFSCDPLTNNADRLFCYQILLDPTVNFCAQQPTSVRHAGCDFSFQGMCLLSHVKLNKYPGATMTRFNVNYRITLNKIPVPGSFVVEDLQLLKRYIFYDILELKDWKAKASCFENQSDICDPIHVFPVFGRMAGDVIDIVPASAILDDMIKNFQPVFSDTDCEWLRVTSDSSFQEHVSHLRGSIVTYPGRKPAAFRVDQVDKDDPKNGNRTPVLIHFTTKASNSVNPKVQSLIKKIEKMRTLIDNKSKEQVTPEDKMKLREQQALLDAATRNSRVKKEVTVVKNSRGFFSSGLRSDVAQWGLLIPWITFHYRYQISLDLLEQKLEYTFNDRNLLTLALTHPSCKSIIGTNPDHIRNSQSNLGFRKQIYGQAEVVPKSGMKTLIYTMAQLGADDEMASPIRNYERLEFLGDAVLEFLTSLRLFLIFPHIQEGGLATFRSTLVQNNQLAVLAEVYHLSHYLLILHGREESSRKRITDRHATANCFEAVCGAIYMDGGIRFVDDLLCRALNARLFVEDQHLQAVWKYPPCHVSLAEYPFGDRHMIPTHELLQQMERFEQTIGIQFNHIRLLANAFSSRSIHENPITLGNNQRLEFLGDTVLQLLVSDYVFKHFPKHHEGHLSLLRSSLVSNKTQAHVCDELGMTKFYIRQQDMSKMDYVPDLKLKDKADLIEAFLGALYLDKGLTVCHHFCMITFYPKLTDFIANQAWSDPKSRLQQCCLTTKRTDGSAPHVPIYKVINKVGPSNNRCYDVAVYLNGERLATGTASNTKLAEEAAAEAALKHPIFCQDITRQRDFAKRAVAAQSRHRSKN